MQHADETAAGTPGTYIDVTAADINGSGAPATVTSGIVKSLITAHPAADITEIGYIGGKRFVQITAVFGGTHATGTPIAIDLVLGAPRSAPV
jgi:hypothetical protein